jgi:voltage-gated potassium channel Kch
VHLVLGDARNEQLMRSLNMARARAVVIATNDDLANLEVAMEVQAMAPGVNVVMRLFDQRLATKVKNVMGVDVSLSTSAVAAPIFAAAALDPRVVGAHRVGDQVMLVVRVDVPRSRVGQTVGHYFAATGHPVLALNGAPTRANQELHPGDVLEVMSV